MDIRQPNITATTDKEQLIQMRSYLYQLSQQLNWAFNNISTTAPSAGGTLHPDSGNVRQSNVEIDGPKTFAAIKNLIIKSADIVDAYYTEINKRLVGYYVAESDFGKYKEETAQEIKATNQNITQLFSNNRELQTAIDELRKESTSAYIKTGLLYENEDGVPVYGLEIGQTNDVNGENVFDKFARFSSERLSFYDSNDTEIAYISDYKLYITHAEITGSLRIINKFKIHYDNGLAFQWIGGET